MQSIDKHQATVNRLAQVLSTLANSLDKHEPQTGLRLRYNHLKNVITFSSEKVGIMAPSQMT